MGTQSVSFLVVSDLMSLRKLLIISGKRGKEESEKKKDRLTEVRRKNGRQ
jgi:hypothetical protein